MTHVPSLRRLLCLLALVAVVLPAASAADRRPGAARVYTLLPASGNPEGVAFDRRSGFFYVSDSTNGGIYRGTLDDPVVHPYLPAGQDGRTAAAGLEVDNRGRLYVAGAGTGSLFVYDTRSGRLLGRFDTGAGGFLNDIAIARNGDVYVTDSLRPFLYRVRGASVDAGAGPVEAIPVEPEIQYLPGFNLNGIVPTDDGKALIVVQTNTGKLFRIEPTASPAVRTIREIVVDGGPLTNGDGLLLDGNELLVVQNQQELLTQVKLSRRGDRGVVEERTTDPTFKTPTTVAEARDRLLVVNSEFFETDGPPYTVSAVREP